MNTPEITIEQIMEMISALDREKQLAIFHQLADSLNTKVRKDAPKFVSAFRTKPGYYKPPVVEHQVSDLSFRNPSEEKIILK